MDDTVPERYNEPCTSFAVLLGGPPVHHSPWRDDIQETREALISVDIEASGPSPVVGSLLSIGACLVDDPCVDFYLGAQAASPDRGWDGQAESGPRALASNAPGANYGLEPRRRDGASSPSWVEARPPTAQGRSLSASTRRSTGCSSPTTSGATWAATPSAFSALDLKSYFMGRHGHRRWAKTRRVDIDEAARASNPITTITRWTTPSGQARLAQFAPCADPPRTRRVRPSPNISFAITESLCKMSFTLPRDLWGLGDCAARWSPKCWGNDARLLANFESSRCEASAPDRRRGRRGCSTVHRRRLRVGFDQPRVQAICRAHHRNTVDDARAGQSDRGGRRTYRDDRRWRWRRTDAARPERRDASTYP